MIDVIFPIKVLSEMVSGTEIPFRYPITSAIPLPPDAGCVGLIWKLIKDLGVYL